MDKNQISQGTHAGVLSNLNHQTLAARVLILFLFLVVSLASVQPRVYGQGADQSFRENHAGTMSPQTRGPSLNCLVCETTLHDCINSGGGDCYGQYNACMASCR